MIRVGFLSLAIGALAVAFLAAGGDPPVPPGPKKVPPELIKEVPADPKPIGLKKADKDDPKGDPKGDKEPGAEEPMGETPKEIIARLHVNMEKAHNNLKDKKDPSEDTRKIQKDIIDDLEKLIKQENDKNCES